jgi:hypothetical protein
MMGRQENRALAFLARSHKKSREKAPRRRPRCEADALGLIFLRSHATISGIPTNSLP